jgi:hypothetical protein
MLDKQDEIGETCSTHGRHDKCVRRFGWKTCREETTQKTYAQMGGHIRLDLREIEWAALGPTQPPIQRVEGCFLGSKAAGA